MVAVLSSFLQSPAFSKDAPSISELTKKAEAGNVKAQFRLGKMYLLGETENHKPKKIEAFNWLQKAANRKYPAAEYLLGTMYLEGSKAVPKDEQKAFKYIELSAEKGFPAAQNKMGDRYLHGMGVEKDVARAAQWFEKAAVQGLAEAQYNLSQRYFKAEGVKQSDEVATKWLLKAANQGYGMATYFLARRYAEGGAGELNYVEAYKWAQIAGLNDFMKRISNKMTPEEIQKAEKLVTSYRPVLEIDPLEPSESRLAYWLMGALVAGLYGLAFGLYRHKRSEALTDESKHNEAMA